MRGEKITVVLQLTKCYVYWESINVSWQWQQASCTSTIWTILNTIITFTYITMQIGPSFPPKYMKALKKRLGCGVALGWIQIMKSNNSPRKTEKNRMIGSQRLYVGQWFENESLKWCITNFKHDSNVASEKFKLLVRETLSRQYCLWIH